MLKSRRGALIGVSGVGLRVGGEKKLVMESKKEPPLGFAFVVESETVEKESPPGTSPPVKRRGPRSVFVEGCVKFSTVPLDEAGFFLEFRLGEPERALFLGVDDLPCKRFV